MAFHHRPNEVAPESRPLVAAVHIASGLVEEMSDSDKTRLAADHGLDSSALIDATFVREAGLEEMYNKSRLEAETLLNNVAKNG